MWMFLAFSSLALAFGAVILGVISAPKELSIFRRIVWSREFAGGQPFRTLRLAMLGAAFVLVVLVGIQEVMSEHRGRFSSWALSEVSSFSTIDVVFVFVVPPTILIVVELIDVYHKWHNDDASRSALVIAALIDMLFLAPILCILMAVVGIAS